MNALVYVEINNMGFLIPKQGKFWSVSLEHFIKHKHLISEEWLLSSLLVGFWRSNMSHYYFSICNSWEKKSRFFFILLPTLKFKVWFACDSRKMPQVKLKMGLFLLEIPQGIEISFYSKRAEPQERGGEWMIVNLYPKKFSDYGQ